METKETIREIRLGLKFKLSALDETEADSSLCRRLLDAWMKAYAAMWAASLTPTPEVPEGVVMMPDDDEPEGAEGRALLVTVWFRSSRDIDEEVRQHLKLRVVLALQAAASQYNILYNFEGAHLMRRVETTEWLPVSIPAGRSMSPA